MVNKNILIDLKITILLCIIIVILVFSIILSIDLQEAEYEIERQIGVDYEELFVGTEYFRLNGFGHCSYSRYLTVRINDELYLYKIVKDGSKVIVELIE